MPKNCLNERQVLDCASPLVLYKIRVQTKSGRGLPQMFSGLQVGFS